MIDLIGLIRMAFWELWKGFMDLPSTFNHGGAYTRWSISISVRGFGIAMFGPVLTLYLVNVFHASKPEIGALTSIAFLVRLLGAPFLGIMVDRHGPKRLMIIGLLLAVVHPIVFGTIPGVSYLFIVYVLSGLYWAFINASWFTWQMNLIPSNCTTDTTIEDACRTMQKKKIKKLAVLRNGLLEGIVSITDIANKHPELIEKFRSKESDTRFNDYIKLLLGSDESQNLEFKFSLRYDLNTRQINQSLGHAILKTLCAFLNSSGGTILVGVSDNKMVTGIENDYCLIKHQNRDGFENHLLGLISTNIGNFYLPYIDVKFHNLLWKDLSQFNVSISSEPAFFDNNGKQEFYVRTGNTSRPFSISEASEYISERWG